MTSSSTVGLCHHCGRTLGEPKGRGRRREYCDSTCRSAGRRRRQAGADLASRHPFARGVHAAIAAGGRSLRSLAGELEEAGYYVASGTLSQWQNGIAVPYPSDDTRDRLLALERILGVPAGSLVVALDETAPVPGPRQAAHRRRAARGGRPRTLDGTRQLLEDRIEAISAGNRGRLAVIEQSEHYTIGQERRPTQSEITYVVSALRPGVDRYWCLYTFEATAPVKVEVRGNCRLGRLIEEPGDGRSVPAGYRLCAAELIFDRGLRAGDLFEFTFALVNYFDTDDLTLPEPEYARVVRSPGCRRLSMRLSFHPQQLPLRVRQVMWTRENAGGSAPARDMPLVIAGGSVDFEQLNPKPAAYGFRWEWPASNQAVPLEVQGSLPARSMLRNSEPPRPRVAAG